MRSGIYRKLNRVKQSRTDIDIGALSPGAATEVVVIDVPILPRLREAKLACIDGVRTAQQHNRTTTAQQPPRARLRPPWILTSETCH